MKKQNKWLAGLSLLVLAASLWAVVAATMTQLQKVLHQTKRSQ